MSSFVPVFRPTGSPLHGVRPGVAAAFALAPCVAALTFDHPGVLAAALACVVVTAAGARVGPELRRAARLAVPLALLVAAINPARLAGRPDAACTADRRCRSTASST